MNWLSLVIAVLALGCGHSAFGAQPGATPLRVRAVQKHIEISGPKPPVSVDLSKEFQGYFLDEAKLLFAAQDAATRSLVVFVSGPSRGPAAAARYCGAGREGYLIWLHFDINWRERKRQIALIESCFESADGNYEIKGQRLTAGWDNHRHGRRFELEYDAQTPQRGFRIRQSKLDQPRG